MSWVLRESEAKLGDRLVLLVLADHAKDDGTYAWPSVDTISEQARLTRRQAQRCLRNLEQTGQILETGKSKKGTTIYTIVGYSKGGVNMSPPGATNRTKGGVRITPDPSLKQPSVVLTGERNGISRSHPMWDPLWDVLTDGFGPATTKDAQGRRAKAVKTLIEVGATPDDVLARGKRWRRHFPGATLTQEALVKWWDTLPRKELR
jgi:hypothetical protein